MTRVRAGNGIDGTVAVHHVAATAAVHVQIDKAGQRQDIAGGGRDNCLAIDRNNAFVEAQNAANPAVGRQDAGVNLLHGCVRHGVSF